MPSKRRNNGRGKKNKGHSNIVVCCNCRRSVGKDKAIKRFQMKAIVDASSKKDIQEASAYREQFHLPKIYVKMQYCVSCAIHARIVRVRSQTRKDRNIRYTTKLRVKTDRRGRPIDIRTGTFSKPTPSLEKQFNNKNRQDGPILQ